MNFEVTDKIKLLIRLALEEDLADRGDITTIATVAADRTAEAILLAKEDCVISGGALAAAVFTAVDAQIQIKTVKADGGTARAGDAILKVSGPVRGILTAERTALNFMQRMSGIATHTRAFTDVVKPYGTMILDTRKTTPAMRALEKYAVQCGGGTNHRMGLYDRVMIKDNHRAMWAEQQRGDLGAAVAHARELYPDVAIEIEVESMEELQQVLPMNPEWVLLDNMSPKDMKACVAVCGERIKTEASGGITLQNVEAAAASGVHAISLGCLTHSSRSVDLSLEMS